MIKIERTEPKSKSWVKWVNKCAAKTTEIIQNFNTGDRLVVAALYKRQKKVFAEWSKGKCAFCEKKLLATQPGDVDHYRPKSGVTDEDWTTVDLCRNGRSGPHPGYFWLTYDASNLIFCCISCNRIGERAKWGKGTRFPVNGFRAEMPGEEANEDPKLLNPYLDDPYLHITMDAMGVYSAVNNSEKGRASIKVFGLNERGLPDERAAKYSDAQKMFRIIMLDTAHGEERVKKLRELVADTQEFVSVTRKAVREVAREFIEDVDNAGVA